MSNYYDILSDHINTFSTYFFSLFYQKIKPTNFLWKLSKSFVRLLMIYPLNISIFLRIFDFRMYNSICTKWWTVFLYIWFKIITYEWQIWSPILHTKVYRNYIFLESVWKKLSYETGSDIHFTWSSILSPLYHSKIIKPLFITSVWRNYLLIKFFWCEKTFNCSMNNWFLIFFF